MRVVIYGAFYEHDVVVLYAIFEAARSKVTVPNRYVTIYVSKMTEVFQKKKIVMVTEQLFFKALAQVLLVCLVPSVIPVDKSIALASFAPSS